MIQEMLFKEVVVWVWILVVVVMNLVIGDRIYEPQPLMIEEVYNCSLSYHRNYFTQKYNFVIGFPRRREGGAFDKDHDSERDNGPWRSKRNSDDDIGRKTFSDRRFDDPDGKRRPFSDRRFDDSDSGRRSFSDRRNDDFDSKKPFGDRHNDIDGRKPFSESRRGFGFKRDDDLPELGNYF